MKDKLTNKIDVNIIIILIFSIFLLSTFITKSLDISYNISNIKILEKSISLTHPFGSKVIVNNDYGYGYNIFNPGFSNYIVAITYKLTKWILPNINYAIKLVHIIELFLSGYLMYVLCNKLFKHKRTSMLSSLLFMSYGYHLNGIYNNILSNTLVYPLLLLIILGLYHLFIDSNKREYYMYFIPGYALLINTNLSISIYVSIILCIILIVNYKKLYNNIIPIIISIITILLISSPYLIPLIEHNSLGIYKEIVSNISINFNDYYIHNTKMIYYSYVSLVLLLLSIYNYKRLILNKFTYYILIISFIALILSVVLNNQVLIILTSTGVSMFAPVYLNTFCNETKRLGIIFVVILTLICSDNIINNIEVKDKYIDNFTTSKFNEKNNIKKVKVTNILPILNKYNNKLGLYRVTNSYNYIDINNNDILKFIVYTDKQVLISIPRIYYLGYNIYVNGEEVNYIEDNNGLINFIVNNTSQVRIEYKGTNTYKFSNILGFVGVLLLIDLLRKKM